MTNKAATSSREFLQRLLGDRRGVTAVFVALAFTMLIGFVGLGVEAGLWYAIKRQDQSAADAAAISGAYEIAQCQTTQNTTCPNYPDICALAKRDAATNGFTFQSYTCPSTSPNCTNPSSGQMCANNPPASCTGADCNDKVEVILNRQQDTFFANLFLSNVTIGSRAVAKVNLPGYTCDLSLAKTGTGINVQGSATLDLQGCGMAANSSDAASISFGGGNNDVLDASWFQTVGNYNANGNPVLNVTTRLVDSTPVTDPYSCNPPQIGCAGQITYVWPGTAAVVAGQPNPPCFLATGNTTLTPGLYGQSNGNNCSDNKSGNGHGPPMEFDSGTTTTLCPGVYYLDGEDSTGNAFYVHGGTVQMGTAGATTNNVTCPNNGMNGVTIIAGSQNGITKGGGFNIVSGSTVTLSAPTARNPSGCTFGSSTGCIPSGILFYQDPLDADTGKQGSGFTGDSSIWANAGTSLQGAMYTPATNVNFQGNANSTCFIVISLTMTYKGNSTMSGNQAACQAVGVTGPTVMNISLTE